MKKWEVLYQDQVSNENIISVLLQNRGFTSQEDREHFLFPRFENLTVSSVGLDQKQIKKTLTRIKSAMQKKEQIVIYGDYDVDGITASAILWETLHALGANVMPYIPHRVDEGYGLSIPGINNIKNPESKLKNASVLITVDNGIVANEAVKYANEQGLDVIITDHHVASDVLPDAYAIVHTTKLCGAGVAYLLAQEIKNDMGKETYDEKNDDLLELATLGTIADLVPLKDGNRIIVKYGLPKLSKTKRPGLLALFQEAGCDNASIGVYEVGHIIAPRLNATGRMASAMDSLRLLCTRDKQRAEELAGLLGTTNRERQNVMLEATTHAKLSVQAREELKKLIIVAHDAYPEGVIGLVAGRLVEEHYRPAIVISRGEKVSKGSVRSVNGFNIIEFLRNSSEFFVNIGGHPMAAGFTIETEKIAVMQSELERLAEVMDDAILVRTLRVDCEVPLSLITNTFNEALKALSPYGMANPEPVFVTRNAIIRDMRVLGREGKHLRLTVSQTNAVMEAIAFGMGEKAQELHLGDAIDLAYTVDVNTWNGRSTLQLKVKDLHIPTL